MNNIPKEFILDTPIVFKTVLRGRPETQTYIYEYDENENEYRAYRVLKEDDDRCSSDVIKEFQINDVSKNCLFIAKARKEIEIHLFLLYIKNAFDDLSYKTQSIQEDEQS